MKVTEPGLNKLIDNLNTLICEDSLLTRQERETLVLAVAAIGAMKARVGLKKGDAPAVARREKREKKDRQPDPRFPRAGHPWQEDEKTLLSDALDSVPDEEIGKHLFWLSDRGIFHEKTIPSTSTRDWHVIINTTESKTDSPVPVDGGNRTGKAPFTGRLIKVTFTQAQGSGLSSS